MIHLDHAATQPLLDAAAAAMAPWWGVPANPASSHRSGQRAASALEAARAQIAALVGRAPAGVVFTSGATEANVTGLRGALAAGGALVISSLEHPCVEGTARSLASGASTVHRWSVDADGRTQVASLDPRTRVVALQAVNHETGVLQPVEAAWEAAQRVGAWLHVDATQAAGHLDLTGMPADAVVLSSHKLGGPPGIGALVLPDGRDFPSLLPGAQERGRRGGTVPTVLAVGFAAAVEEAIAQREVRVRRAGAQRARVDAALVASGGRIVGARATRIAATTLAVFDGLQGASLVAALDLEGFAVSAGAACASGSLQASPVLVAMGDPSPDAGLRISLGPATTDAEVAAFLAVLPRVVAAQRAAAAFADELG